MTFFSPGIDSLTPEKLVALGQKPKPSLNISSQAKERVAQYRKIVEDALRGSSTIYGVNTGFGYLSDVHIPSDKLEKLQVNLIRSHACGLGKELASTEIRSLLVLRVHTFLLGHSAVRWEVVEKALQFLENDVLPIVPELGSVGASGDLAPLAHLALALIGEGEVYWRDEKTETGKALKSLGIAPLVPQAKEGLALINGTHFMTTLASYALVEAENLVQTADVCAALSLEALRGTKKAFDERIHAIRAQKGQQAVAAHLRALLTGPDEIMESHANCGKVQDPYSFRCVPQVHGASRDALAYVREKVSIELNSVTDNPLVFLDGDVCSGGNFHGQPIALSMDFLGIAVAEIGSIAERRIEKLTNPNLSGLPAFVTTDSGLNSGYMIPHVVAAALVSENKVLCHPASVDSIPTSADKEDHVSMGPIAARKARKINLGVARILSIELLAACQALDILKPLRPSPALQKVYQKVRTLSPYQAEDRAIYKDIEALAQLIMRGDVLAWVNEK